MKNINRYLFAMMMALPMLLSGCSTGPEKKAYDQPEQVKASKSMESKYAASEMGAQDVAEVKFQKGSHSLNEENAEKIRAVVSGARAIGNLDEVKVIVWADNEYPSDQAKKLPPDQQTLAVERAEEIRRLLLAQDDARKLKLKVYNMAKRPNALAKLFRSSDFRIKRSLEKAGVPNSDSPVKKTSFASKALVMVLTRPDSGAQGN